MAFNLLYADVPIFLHGLLHSNQKHIEAFSLFIPPRSCVSRYLVTLLCLMDYSKCKTKNTQKSLDIDFLFFFFIFHVTFIGILLKGDIIIVIFLQNGHELRTPISNFV